MGAGPLQAGLLAVSLAGDESEWDRAEGEGVVEEGPLRRLSGGKGGQDGVGGGRISSKCGGGAVAICSGIWQPR